MTQRNRAIDPPASRCEWDECEEMECQRSHCAYCRWVDDKNEVCRCGRLVCTDCVCVCKLDDDLSCDPRGPQSSTSQPLQETEKILLDEI